MTDTLLLEGFEPTPIELVRSMPMSDRVLRALKLIQDNEPPDGYYLAYSGGKDSVVIKHLALLAGVKFEAWYNQTTIDPPELVRFIKQQADVKWNVPERNMMARAAGKGMPTRFVRWCCSEYKENGGGGRVCIFGVRAEESRARALRWNEVGQGSSQRKVVCPIVYWTTDQVWEFIRHYDLSYCELYDEGWDRLGCVGCPLKNREAQQRDFDRWPRYEQNWKNACRKYWETHRTQVLKNGKLNFCSNFKTWQSYWEWWRNSNKTPDIMREECQTGLLWTNQELDEEAK